MSGSSASEFCRRLLRRTRFAWALSFLSISRFRLASVCCRFVMLSLPCGAGTQFPVWHDAHTLPRRRL